MNPVLTSNLIWIVAIALDLTIRVLALVYIPRNRKPSSAMAWLLAIFLIPFIGIFFFLLIGSPKLGRKRREEQKLVDQKILEADASLPTVEVSEPSWLPAIVRMNLDLGKLPLSAGNTSVLNEDYDASIVGMAREIDTAEKFVHVEFYIVALDEVTQVFFTAMQNAVKRGVTVRLLMDHVASVRAAGHKRTIAELDRIGVQWHYMLPFQPLKGNWQRPDLRNHRKLVVVDGRVAFMGSQNLIARNYNSAKNIKRGLMWQELITRVTGPVVSHINVVFLSDWYFETKEILDDERVPAHEVPVDTSASSLNCQVLPSGPGYDRENNLRLFLGLLNSAQERIIITSPYFVPDEAMMYAITMACQRGLDVQLFVSEIGDQGGVWHAQRSYYSELLDAGVKIWMYPAPYILHAKHLSIDDDVAVIGSSNMDIRSFALDLEVSLLVHGKSFVDDMREVEQHYRDISTELTAGRWAMEPTSARTLDGVARLTSALQ